MTDILIEGRAVKNGVTVTEQLKINIDYHVEGTAQVTIINKRKAPHIPVKTCIKEGETEFVAGVKVEHKAAEEDKK